jgi:hypothetical protein
VRAWHHATQRSSDRRAPMVRRRHPRSGELDRLHPSQPVGGEIFRLPESRRAHRFPLLGQPQTRTNGS